jgi:hypothetical protein
MKKPYSLFPIFKKIALVAVSFFAFQVFSGAQTPFDPYACFGYLTLPNTKEPSDDFFSTQRVHDISIRFEQKNFAQMLDSFHISKSEEMVLASVFIDGTEYKNVGVAYRGISFMLNGKRNPFHIKLNYIDKKQNHNGVKWIKLSNALRDPSMVREVLGYEIARKYMPAPRANYTNLTINGENRGVYVNVESPSEEFLSRNFSGYTGGSLFRCAMEPTADQERQCESRKFGSLGFEENPSCYLKNFEMRSKDGWDDLIELTRYLMKNSEQIDKILNVDQTLWYLAFNNVCVNLYSYSGGLSNNYFLYKDKKGKFIPIVGDLNFAFGTFKNTGVGTDFTLEQLQELDPLLHANNALKPLISQLLKNPDYKKLYLSHVRQIVNDWFESGLYEKRAAELQKTVESAVINDKTIGYSPEEFKKSMTTTVGQLSKVPGLTELMSRRAKFLKKHPEVGGVLPPIVTDIRFSTRDKYSSSRVESFKFRVSVDRFPKRVRVVWRAKGETDFQNLDLFDDGEHGDGRAGDKNFGNTILPSGKFSEIEYYIVAENSVLMSVEPNNYMFKLKTTSLEELNQ